MYIYYSCENLNVNNCMKCKKDLKSVQLCIGFMFCTFAVVVEAKQEHTNVYTTPHSLMPSVLSESGVAR